MSAEDWLWIEARGVWLRGDGLELRDDGQDWYVRGPSFVGKHKLCDSVCAPSWAQREADRDFPTDLLKEDRGWLEAEARMASAAHEEAQHRAAYQDRRRARLQAALRALEKREKAREIEAKRERKRNPFGIPKEEREARRWVRVKLAPVVRERFGGWGNGGRTYSTVNDLRRAFWVESLNDAAEARRVRTPWQARRLLRQAAVWRFFGEMTMIPGGGA